jgi:hypothetical protein
MVVHIGDVVRLRKPHACGANEWEIVRLGADIGLRCQQCAHRILMPRSDLERRCSGFIRRAEQVGLPAALDTSGEP